MKINKNIILVLVSFLLLASCATNEIKRSKFINESLSWGDLGNANKLHKKNIDSIDSILIPSPANDPKTNLSNIYKAILAASKMKGFTKVIFQDGQYKIVQPISLKNNLDSLILMGRKSTEIKFIGKSNKPASILKIYGKKANWKNASKIIAYDSSTNSIIFEPKVKNIKVGDFFDIRLPNGSWHDSKNHKSWNPKNYLGTIVKIIRIDSSDNRFILNQSIDFEWELAKKENFLPQIAKFHPIKSVGIENLKFSTNNKNNRQGVNIDIFSAANCWVKNVESEYAASVHINIGSSTNIEVKNSTIHHAKDYGNPANPDSNLITGTGYGVNVARSSNCLIESNTFYHLRHAMIIALGSNRNVFGYNHSYDQYSYPVKNLSDLNLHGHFPYNNLFEGNIVERIHADQWWGSNGPNNTFFKNKVTDGEIKLEKTNDAILIENDAEIELIDSDIKNYTKNELISHLQGESFRKQNEKNELKSLYK